MSYSRSFLGKGTIYRRKRGVANAPLEPMGNCSKLVFNVEQERIDELDYESAGGGKRMTIYRISGVTAAITTKNHDPMILALGLRGIVTEQDSVAPITGEAHADVAKGSLVVFDRFPDLTQPIVVKKGATPIAQAANYEPKRVGIFILADAVGVTAGDDITVEYTPLAEDTVEALTVSGDEYYLFFDGLNEAASGKPVAVEAMRLNFSPMKNLGLVTTELGDVELEAEVLGDESVTAEDESKYFRYRAVK